MRILQSLLAIAGGFAWIALTIAVTTLLTRWLVPSWTQMPPSRAARLFNVMASCVFAMTGGLLTVRLAPVSPLVHALILAIIVLLLSTIAASELRGSVAGIYPLALAVLPSLATLGGAILAVLYL